MPISPNQALIIMHGERGLAYMDVDDRAVSEINSRTRFQCDREFVVKRAYLEPQWFDPGVEPEDSWDKTHGQPQEGA